MPVTVGVVGAGGGGAAATYSLANALQNVDITVFEKSRGVCGRAAARRRGDIVYEYGANYLQDADNRVNALVTGPLREGLVAVEGPIRTVDADGDIREGPHDDERRWTYEDGITRLAKHLLDVADATVRRETRIVDLQHDGGWRLTDGGGAVHGPFDVLLLNPPAPQTASLLSDTGQAVADRLGEAAARIDYRPSWTAVLGYEFVLEAPYYGLRVADEHPAIAWIGREACKPGHVPDGTSVLVVQAQPDWAADRYDAPPDDTVAALAGHTAALLDDPRLATPHWTDHQGWRYAFPTGRVAERAVRAATEVGVYVTGDWVAGDGRLHAALRNGLETGDAVAAAWQD